MFYDLIIGPIEYIFELVFEQIYNYTSNIVLSLLFLSFTVTLLTSPLYDRADVVSSKLAKKHKDMESWEAHIRLHFKGDERSFIRQRYYRIMNHGPIHEVMGIVPILLQIPFFIAAYHYLNTTEVVAEEWFLKPDMLLNMGKITINLLPFIMTGINYLSLFFYSKIPGSVLGKTSFILPLIFLVLLYGSPSGLLVYWIFNNTFSLIRNIIRILRIEKPVKKAGIVVAYITLCAFFTLTIYDGCDKLQIEVARYLEGVIPVAILLLLHIPLLFWAFLKEKGLKLKIASYKINTGDVITVELIMFLFCALYIPGSVIEASPGEFVSGGISGLATLMRSPILFFAGMFLVWFNVVYLLLLETKKTVFYGVITGITVFMFFDHFLWSNNNGLLLANVRYEKDLVFTYEYVLLSLLCFNAILIILVVMRRFKWPRWLNAILLLSILAMTLFRFGSINIKLSRLASTDEREETGGDEKIFELSRNGRNVIVIMMDRAIGAYVPFIMDERKGLSEKYDGFCYYPNTVSFARSTNFGSPALFGGYEYMPSEINKRTDILLKDKHNEALKLMPAVFSDNGFKINVSSVPYGNYVDGVDMSIYDGMEGVKAFSPEKHVALENVSQEDINKVSLGLRDYSIFRISPYCIQNYIYYGINKKRIPVLGTFVTAYRIMDGLSEFTEIEDDDTDHMCIYVNLMTHDAAVMQLPDYTYPENGEVDDSEYELFGEREVNGRKMHLDVYQQIAHYHSNVAALELLGKWFDYLRDLGVYDNSRIIIASDHGFSLGQFDDLIVNEELDVEGVNCLMLYKDFNSKGFRVSDEFMTNADVPILAMKGIITDPQNPFTGNSINDDMKNRGPVEVTLSDNWGVQGGTVFDTSDAPWYSIYDDIFKKENWNKIRN